MRRLVYLTSAQEDLRHIRQYVARESGNRRVARGFVDKLRAQCSKLASLPGTLGRARPELRNDVRSFAYRGYVIFFRYDESRFEVVNVVEGHLDLESLFGDDLLD